MHMQNTHFVCCELAINIPRRLLVPTNSFSLQFDVQLCENVGGQCSTGH